MDYLVIDIENFRNIINTDKRTKSLLLFDNKKINFIVGDNNIGKTNILCAIKTLSLETKNNQQSIDFDRDKPYGILDSEKLDDLEISIGLGFDLPKEEKIRFFSEFMTADEIDAIKDKVKDFFRFGVSGNLSTKKISSWYSKPFVNEELEKKYESKIDDFVSKVLESHYPIVYNLIGENDVVIDNINFSLQDIEKKIGSFGRLDTFLNAFSLNIDEKNSIIENLKFLKKLMPQSLNSEERLRWSKKVDLITKQTEETLNRNIKKTFSIFTTLHSQLNIRINENKNIELRAIPNEFNNKNAILLDYQGKGIIKIIKLVYLLQICAFDKKHKHIVLVDEIENNLSINTQYALSKYLKNIVNDNDNIYLVMVTHSPIFFDKTNEGEFDKYFSLTICSIEKTGELKFEQINSLKDFVKNGYELPNGKDLDGVTLLSYMLDMPALVAKQITKDKNN